MVGERLIIIGMLRLINAGGNQRFVEGNLGGMIQGRRIGETLWLLIVWQLWRSHVLGEPLENSSWNHPFLLPYQLWRFTHRCL